MKRALVLTALAAACFPAVLAPAQRQDPDRAARADNKNIPRPIERAILRRYDDAKITLAGTRQLNGVTVYDVKAATGRGDIDASVTEGGDVLILGYPGVTEQTLPPPVRSLLADVFPRIRPEEVEKFERTTYSIDLDMGGRRDVRASIDPVGRLRDIKSAAELRQQDIRQLERATRQDEQALRPRLEQYFMNPKVRAVYRHPDAQGYFWVDLSTDTDENVRVLMNAQREVAMYDVKIDPKNLPAPVRQTLEETLDRGKVREVYRHQLVYYQVATHQRDGDALTLSITPLGSVVGLRSDSAEDEERRVSKRPERKGVRRPNESRGVRG